MRATFTTYGMLLLMTACGCGQATTPQTTATGDDAQRPPSKSAEPALLTTTDASALRPVPASPSAAAPEVTPTNSAETQQAQQAFQRLLAAAEGGHPEEWTAAETELQQLGAAVVPALVPALHSNDSLTREMAVMFLAQQGPAAASARPALEAILDDPSPFVRVNAAALLTVFDEPSPRAIETLIELTTNEASHVRVTAIGALGNVPAAARDAIPVISRSLDDSDAPVRLAAASTLARFGTAARPALSQLKQLAADSDPEVKQAAVEAINAVDPTISPASLETVPASAQQPE